MRLKEAWEKREEERAKCNILANVMWDIGHEALHRWLVKAHVEAEHWNTVG